MARRKSLAVSSIPDGKARLNLLIDGELKNWAQDFSKKNNTTITAVITRYFTILKQVDKSGGEVAELLASLRSVMKEIESDNGVEQI